jgi:hypothetical protein
MRASRTFAALGAGPALTLCPSYLHPRKAMSNNWNRFFAAEPKGYIKEHFLTAVGIRKLPAGPRQFDLHHQVVHGYKIARIDAWDASSCDDEPLNGYWVPQGGSCLIPRFAHRSHYVFTPDFSGCAILVDQISANQYRVYHVQGSKRQLEQEYLRPRAHAHGLGLAGAMTFGDYSAACIPCKTRCGREQTRGFAFLKFENGRWWIYAQGQNGVGLGYADGRYTPTGPQTPSGGVRMPVADLTCEVPRAYAGHDGADLPVPTRASLYANTYAASALGVYTRSAARRAGILSRMLPNEERW